MVKKIVLALCASIIIGIGACSLLFVTTPTFHGKQELLIQSNKPHILLLCLVSGMGGGEEHFIKLSSMLDTHGYPTTMITEHNSRLSEYFTAHKIPHYTTHASLFLKYLRPLHHFILEQCMETIYQKNPYVFIHCNNIQELTAAQKIAKKHPVKIIFTRHITDHFNTEKAHNILAVIGVTQQITDYLKQENEAKNLAIKNIVTIPGLFDHKRCLEFTPSSNRYDFFSSEFHITLNNAPVFTTIANFYQDPTHKNHALLIEAIDHLVNKEQYRVNIILAGDGPSRPLIETMVKERKLTHYVHFLGYTKKIPALLYHSDCMILPSRKEALPLVYFEAGLMKKPSIGATETGAETAIIHEKTGLLFKNDNKDDLVTAIKRLLDNPKLAHQLGKNAYMHVLKNFVPEVTFLKYEKLYQS